MFSDFFEFMAADRDSDDSCGCPHHQFSFRSPPRKPRKTPTKTEVLNVTLEDLYKGKSMKFNITRTRNFKCYDCKGSGTIKYPAMKCLTCHGKGKYAAKFDNQKKKSRKNGKATYQKHCTRCDGRGRTDSYVERCLQCYEKSITHEKKLFEVEIAPGMRDGQRIMLSGEGDEKDGFEAGDIVFVIKCKKHELFERNGDDLTIAKKIGLGEALCGTHMVIPQLDGRNLLLKREEGGIIQSGFSCRIKNEGMPVYNQAKKRGNLIIKFEVAFPSPYFFKDQSLYKKLEEALPPKEHVEPDPESEEVCLQEYDESRYKHCHNKRRNAYDSESDDDDEEEEGHHHRGRHPQCPVH